MTNMSGPLSVVEQQAIRMAITDGLRCFKISLVLGTHVLFIFINLAMLFTVWSKPSFRYTTRYMLFANMLFNDTVHLAMCLVLYLLSAFYFTVVRAACALMVLLSSTTFTNAPLNLAVMSLERYTAVCFPLRHGELTTPGRTWLAVGLVWVLGCFNVLMDVCALFLTEPSFFLSPALCTLEQLQTASWQAEKGVVINALLFVAVTAVLLFTYVAILVEARSASSDPGSTRRALRTVLLHGLQLGLSLMSFLYVLMEALLAMLPPAVYRQMRYVNFFVVLVLPRCLSSLVYGLRDEAFRPAFRQQLTCCSGRRVGPPQTARKC